MLLLLCDRRNSNGLLKFWTSGNVCMHGKSAHSRNLIKSLFSVELLRLLKHNNSPISFFLKEGMLIQTSNPELFLLHTAVCQEHKVALIEKHDVIDKTAFHHKTVLFLSCVHLGSSCASSFCEIHYIFFLFFISI